MANKSVVSQKRKLKRASIGMFSGEIGCILAPFVGLLIANKDDYFVDGNGTKVTFSFIMLAATIIITLCLMVKKTLKLDLFSLLTGLVVVDAVCFMLGRLINDLAYILLWVIIGVVGALILEITRRKKVTDELEIIDKAIEKAKTDQYAEMYKEDSTKKVRVKIKK